MNRAAEAVAPISSLPGADWRDYIALMKPRVMSLSIFTAFVGMVVAPGGIHPVIGLAAILSVAIGAGASGALNQWWEAGLDGRMRRTSARPIPSGRVGPDDALAFGVTLGALAVMTMGIAVGWFAAALLLATILFYVVVYTIWLKPATPHNIVIGGAAGAIPPLIGWVAATGSVAPLPLLMFAIIFLWTPPHFWALALFVRGDYANAGVPMLPVTDGVAATRRQIAGYSVALVLVSLSPWAFGLAGWVYGLVAAALGVQFARLAWGVATNRATEAAGMAPEKRLFRFSLVYLFVLFAAFAVDRFAA